MARFLNRRDSPSVVWGVFTTAGSLYRYTHTGLRSSLIHATASAEDHVGSILRAHGAHNAKSVSILLLFEKNSWKAEKNA
jgi:hypothetical protein